MRTLALVCFTVLLCGCESLFTPGGSKPCERVWPQSHNEGPIRVAMFDSVGRCPSRECRVFQPGETLPPHTVIALMSCGGHAQDEGQFIGVMIMHAKRIGANGFVLLPYEAPNSTVTLAHPLWQNPGQRVYRANAIIISSNTPNAVEPTKSSAP